MTFSVNSHQLKPVYHTRYTILALPRVKKKGLNTAVLLESPPNGDHPLYYICAIQYGRLRRK